MSKQILGPKGWPFIGNVGNIDINRLHVSFYDLQREFGDVFQLWLFGQNVIVIGEVSLMKKAFNRQELCFRSKDFFSTLKYNNGYLNSNFTAQERKLKSILWRAIASTVDDVVLKNLYEKERNKFLIALDTDDDFPIRERLYQTAARLFSITIAGIEPTDKHMNAIVEFAESYFNMYKGGFKISVLSTLPCLRHFSGSLKAAYDRIITARNELADTLVADARKNHARSREHGILQHMMSAAPEDSKDNVITQESLVACTMDLLFNGVDPLPNNVAYILLQAIKQPQMQQKIHDELDGVLKDKGAVMDIRPEHVPYLEAFILESMRFVSQVNLSVGHAVIEDTVVDGYLFPKGSTILGNQFSLHHDEKLWDQPWEFKPDRFLDEKGKSLPVTHPVRTQLFHFGVGLRRCRGQQIAMEDIFRLTLGIFSKYKVLPPTDSNLPSTDPRHYSTLIVIVVPDFKCRFEKKMSALCKVCE